MLEGDASGEGKKMEVEGKGEQMLNGKIVEERPVGNVEKGDVP
mgnify:CR=1 FL=1